MGARRKANGEGKGGSRRKGKPQGHREEGGGQHLLPPISLHFERGSTCCPVSFPFKRGQRVLPPFLFILNGAALAAPFLFISNGAALTALFLFLYPPITGGI